MITRIEVNGFKSLEHFEIDFHPGLNVLVGPNGGGKTNIILFFEFLSHLVKTDISEAISRLGGAGSVFRRLDDAKYQDTIEATIFGCQQFESKKFCHYRYYFEIFFPKEIESVIFRHQIVNMRFSKSFIKTDQNRNKDIAWDIVINQSFDKSNIAKIKIDAKDPKLLRFPYVEQHIKREITLVRRAEKMISRISSTQSSLFYALSRFFPSIPPVISDLISGETYNIVPSRVKIPEDSAKAPGMEKDGAGLSATLYAIKRKKGVSDRHLPYFLYYRRPIIQTAITLQDLLKYINLANTSIGDIDVVNDPFNNQLKVMITIVNGGYQATLPLSSMSDGTIKWIAMITAVMTTTSMFAIEEPENYLHPLMQSQILEIMRDILVSRKNYSFSLMTTHSETILNSCNPEELIVVTLSEGMTCAKRCSNAAQLRAEVKRSGFGLGYYYLAGAVEDE